MNNNNNNKKGDTLPTLSIFPNDFSQVVYLFLTQKSVKQAQTIHLME